MQAWAQWTAEMTLQRVRRWWLEEGEPRKVKRDQVVRVALDVHSHPQKTDAVTQQGWQWGWGAAGLSPALAWCYWSALLHKGDSLLLRRLQYPNRRAETSPSALPSYSGNTACFQARPWTHLVELRPQKAPCCSLPCRLFALLLSHWRLLGKSSRKIHFWPKAMWTFNASPTSQRTKLLEPRSSHHRK